MEQQQIQIDENVLQMEIVQAQQIINKNHQLKILMDNYRELQKRNGELESELATLKGEVTENDSSNL